MTAPHPEPLLTGLRIGECARWHDGRLWLANWGQGEVLAVDAEGRSEVMVEIETSIPISIDWLADGPLLVVSGPRGPRPAPGARRIAGHPRRSHRPLAALVERDRRRRTRQRLRQHDQLRHDGRGRVRARADRLVSPDGSVRQVADGLQFPNGMVVTPDNSTLICAESFAGRLTAFEIEDDGSLSNRRVWAELGEGGDGICLDAEGAIWSPAADRCERVREGGEKLETSSSTGSASPARSAARTARRCSCWPHRGWAPRRCSTGLRAGSCGRSTRRRRAPAGPSSGSRSSARRPGTWPCARRRPCPCAWPRP